MKSLLKIKYISNNLKRVILILVLFAGVGTVKGQVVEWAKELGQHMITDHRHALKTDQAGNSYYTGYFFDELTIGTTTVVSAGNNMYLTKIDASGNVVWIKPFPGNATSGAGGTAVEADSNGNVYLAGHFQGQMQFGSTLLFNSGYNAMFLTKLDVSGNVIWAKQGSTDSHIYSLSLDGLGNCLLTGYAGNSSGLFYYDGQIISAGDGSSFLLKTDNDGQLLWGRRFQSEKLDVAADAFGNGIITGYFGGTSIDFGNGISITAPVLNGQPTSYMPGFVARFNPSGQFVWANMISGLFALAESVKLSHTGDLFIMGSCFDSLSYAGSLITGLPNTSIGNDLFILKLTSGGSLQWGKRIPQLGDDWIQLLLGSVPYMEIDSGGNVIVLGQYQGTLQTSGNNYHYPHSQTATEVIIAKYNTNGDFMWSQAIGGVGFAGPTGLGIDGLGNIYVSGLSVQDSLTAGNTIYFGNSITLPATENLNGFICKILGNANKITGTVFLDSNSSGTQETNEIGVSTIPVSVTGSLPVLSDNSGLFTAFTNSGNFQITIPQVPPSYALGPASHTAAFANLGQNDSLNNFSLQPIGTVQDLQVSVVQLNPARPGFAYRNRITYRNMGTIPTSGSIQFVADPLLNFQSALPAASVQTGDTLNWAFTALQPFEMRQITVEWQLPPTAALGTTLNQLAIANPVSGDPTPADNFFSDSTTVTGSFDPNDKLVSHAQLTQTQVANWQPLTYTIRFQNTGTDTAFTVMVRDQLPPSLYLNSLEVISASHPYQAEITGPTQIDWKFQNILLPDSNTNEAASHGYIQYRITPLNNLTPGNQINTSAAIYFDFNAPVLTNTAQTEVVQVNSLASNLESNALKLFPNPTSGNVTLLLQTPGLGVVQVRVFNTLGQVVHQSTGTSISGNFQQHLNTSMMPPGMYVVQAQKNGRIFTRKLVRQ